MFLLVYSFIGFCFLILVFKVPRSRTENITKNSPIEKEIKEISWGMLMMLSDLRRDVCFGPLDSVHTKYIFRFSGL